MLGWADERFTEMDLLCDFLKKENIGADSCVSPSGSGKEMTPTRQTRGIGAGNPVPAGTQWWEAVETGRFEREVGKAWIRWVYDAVT